MQRNRGKDENGQRVVEAKHEEHDMTTKPEQLVKTMKGMRSVRVAGPNERLFGGKGILVRYKPNLTDDSPEKSSMPTTESGPTSPPATAASSSTAVNPQGTSLASRLGPGDPTAEWSAERYAEWLKTHPPEPISPEVEQLVRDLM